MTGNLFDLSGRVALVTGANSGIGREVARGLMNAGAHVAIAGRRSERNAHTVAELGGDAAAFDLDVCDEDAVARTVDAVVTRFGRLDILVNNAGAVNRGSVLELTLADWNRVLTTNLTGSFLCTKHAARRMCERRSGKIINVASVYGLVAPSRGLQVAYTAAKHGLIGLTKVNAVELAAHGIQVNAVAPGYVFTEMTGELRGTTLEGAIKRRTPNGRLGETSDLVGVCVFLASSAADHISGQCISVDGGYLASDGLERS